MNFIAFSCSMGSLSARTPWLPKPTHWENRLNDSTLLVAAVTRRRSGASGVEDGERRQSQPGRHHLLQRDIDQVGGPVLRRGLLANRHLSDLPCLGLLLLRLHPLAHLRTLPLSGPACLVQRERALRQLDRTADEVDHHLRILIRLREPAHPLIRLQRHQQRELMPVGVHPLSRPRSFLPRRHEDRCSSCAVISHSNRDYAVRSIEVTSPAPDQEIIQYQHQRSSAEWVTATTAQGAKIKYWRLLGLPRRYPFFSRGIMVKRLVWWPEATAPPRERHGEPG